MTLRYLPKQYHRTLGLINRLINISILTGETGAGKSSLINLLLNDNVLPTCITQNTNTICEISYGPTKEAVIHFLNTSEPALVLKKSKFDKVKRYIEKPAQNEPWCEKIEIKIPHPLLKVQNKICLYQRFHEGKITYYFCRPEAKEHGRCSLYPLRLGNKIRFHCDSFRQNPLFYL